MDPLSLSVDVIVFMGTRNATTLLSKQKEAASSAGERSAGWV